MQRLIVFILFSLAANSIGCGDLDSQDEQSTATFALTTTAKPVKPVLECVDLLPSNQFLAHFGYQNDNAEAADVPAGANNKFSPNPSERSQPTHFLPGRQRDVFTVTFPVTNLVWTLQGPDGTRRTSTASSTSKRCVAACAVTCLHGGTCSAGACQCTAGWTGADCATLVCSTACATGKVCSSPDVCTCVDGDLDGDGTCDAADGCPSDPAKTLAGLCGCGHDDLSDIDGDSVVDCLDLCPQNSLKSAPGICGCGVPDLDDDFDGVPSCIDACPTDPTNDADGDGICGAADNCPNVHNPDQLDSNGNFHGDACGCEYVVCTGSLDSCHGGSICNPTTEACEFRPLTNETACDDGNACSIHETCFDGACAGGVPLACPIGQSCLAGSCGCTAGWSGADCTVPVCSHGCTGGKLCLGPDYCACTGADTDADGTCDELDACPLEPGRIVGPCACDGGDVIDSDYDGTQDCADLCPADGGKQSPGTCGCGVAETDSDYDGVPDCTDVCAYDYANDADGDGLCAANDNCPNVSNIDQADTNANGHGDACGCEYINCGGPIDTCHANSECNAASESCEYPLLTNATACNDSNACTTGETCQDGGCIGGTPVICPTGQTCFDGNCGCYAGWTGSACTIPVCSAGCSGGKVCLSPDSCGCTDADTDGDGTCDAFDGCPLETGLVAGPCVCDGSDLGDTDFDGVPDCADLCPADSGKRAAGICGCGIPDTDNDYDGIPDCLDLCPYDYGNDPDQDGLCSAVDNCPMVSNADQIDSNGNGHGDACGCDGVYCGSSIDSCHGVGVCNAASETCDNPVFADGTSCEDGDSCSSGDQCNGGICVPGAPTICLAPGPCQEVGVCQTGIGCLYPSRPDGVACEEGDLCSTADVCYSGTCYPGPYTSCDSGGGCTDSPSCDTTTGRCIGIPKPEATECDDGNVCTTGDNCQSGKCSSGTPVACTQRPTCPSLDICNQYSGTCDAPQGCSVCGDGVVGLGETCDNGTGYSGKGCSAACAVESCGNGVVDQGGVLKEIRFKYALLGCGNASELIFWLDGVEVGRSALPQGCDCNNVAISQFSISNPSLLPANGSAFRFDVTLSGNGNGVKVGWIVMEAVAGVVTRSVITEQYNYQSMSASPRMCRWMMPNFPQDGYGPRNSQVDYREECDDGNKVAGDGCSTTCRNETCGNGWLDPGEECDDGVNAGADSCTVDCKVNRCFAIECPGRDPSYDKTCKESACDPASGQCVVSDAKNGSRCTDGALCTQTDTCQQGVCIGANPLLCPNPDPKNPCWQAGFCEPSTGTCKGYLSNASCDDGDPCTGPDRCVGSLCQPSAVKVCEPPDQCHTARCDKKAGGCVYENVADNTACTDENRCTRNDRCMAGVCVSVPVACIPSDWCSTAACDPYSGECVETAKPDYTQCNDGTACTMTDTCLGGKCFGRNPVSCLAQDDCHANGACDPTSGQCTVPPLADGTQCNDGNLCTSNDRCLLGKCTQGASTVCPVSAGCRIAGECLPGFGTCTASTECTPCGNELVEPGEQCDDGNEVAGDGCSANCQDENCGDGHLGSLPIHRLDLTWLGSNCETGERSLTLSANGSELWRESVVSNCGCTPGIQRRSIAVPSVLRKLKDGKNRFEWAFSGAQGDKLAWAIVRVIGVETKDVVLVDVNGGGDAAANRVDLCAADSEIALSEPIKHVVDVYLNLYEECDDGNQIGGDGCAADCLNEPAATRRLCGNRRIDSSEECDDGNVQSGDGCSSTCMREQ